MNKEEAIRMLKAKLECMTRDVSGRDSDCINRRCDECPLNYEKGNMGEQKEWLRMSIDALQEHQHYKDLAESYEKTINKLTKAIAEEQPNEDCISRQAVLELVADYDLSMGQVVKGIHNLPSATPQPCNDCISRKEAIDELKHQAENMLCWSGRYNEQRKGILTAINIVSDLSSVTPQQKTGQQKIGHWIGDDGTTVYVNPEGNVTESRDKGEAVKCSECGEWLVGSDEYVCGGRFCPSCGVKMEEKK